MNIFSSQTFQITFSYPKITFLVTYFEPFWVVILIIAESAFIIKQQICFSCDVGLRVRTMVRISVR